MNSSDELQQAILNNIPDQAWLKDRDSRYVLVNDAFVAACARPASGILHHQPTDVWPVDWGRKYIKTDRAVMQSGKRIRYEEWRHGANGAIRWFDTIKTPVYDRQGELIGTVGISRDITDRKQAEQALARLNRLYAVRSKTNQAIVRMPDRDQLFDRVCQIAVQAGGLQMAWIGLINPLAKPSRWRQRLKLISSFASQLHLPSWLAQRMNNYDDPEVTRLQRASFRHFICSDVTAPRHFAEQAALVRELGLSSFGIFPLTQGGIRVGAFVLCAADAGFFTRDIVQLLDALSADLSFALDAIAEAQRRREVEQELRESRSQLRALSAYLQSVREEERTRIARELHDELGQSLTAIRIGLGVMESQQGPAGPYLDNLHTLKDIADSTMTAVQRIAADLRPLMLDELGLAAAIEWLLESFGERGGIACELLLPPAGLEAEREVSTAIFRIVQEALTNVCRHGQARRVVVELRDQGPWIFLKITDDGVGMALPEQEMATGLGLIGMRERAYMLGGTLKLQSRSGAGTSIEVQLPRTVAAGAP